jgi:hypothetical protein
MFGVLASGSAYSPRLPVSPVRDSGQGGFRPRLQLRGSAGLTPASRCLVDLDGNCVMIIGLGHSGVKPLQPQPRPPGPHSSASSSQTLSWKAVAAPAV